MFHVTLMVQNVLLDTDGSIDRCSFECELMVRARTVDSAIRKAQRHLRTLLNDAGTIVNRPGDAYIVEVASVVPTLDDAPTAPVLRRAS